MIADASGKDRDPERSQKGCQMKKLLLLPIFAALLLAAPSALAVTKTVAITSAGFVPNAITINAGDSITWTNSDTKNHQPISQSKDASFASPILKPGETFTFTFAKDGKFTITDALVNRVRMTVTVKKVNVTGSPTLTSNKKKVIYGGAVVLTGKIPVAKAGDKITLRAEVLRPNGTKQTSNIADTTTDGTGAFTFANVPTAQTTYTVVWQGVPPASATSNAVLVSVAPRIGFGLVRKVGRLVTFSMKATSAIPYVGHSVNIQRRNSLGQWVSLKRVVLKSSTVATRAAVRLPKGLSRIRILMPQAQVGTGYVTGVSRVILVRL
jgi:plastocyanin